MTTTSIGTKRRVGGVGLAAMLLMLAGSSSTRGAERIVLCEEFMRVSCTYCATAAGPALDWMMDAYPDTFVLAQIHTAPSARTTPWGTARISFYSVPAVPAAWFDGVDDYVGAFGWDPNDFPYGDPNANYEVYEAAYLARRATPTDVTISLSAVKVSETNRYVSALVGIEGGGQGKTLRIQMVQVLDHWPAVATYCRNGVRQGATAQDITLGPGQQTTVTNTFTLGDDSLADEGNAKFVVWAQEPNSTGPAEVYNAAFVTGPFQYLAGDTNCDGIITYGDINPFVLAISGQSAYESAYPTCRWLNADCNADSTVTYGDINPFVGALAGK